MRTFLLLLLCCAHVYGRADDALSDKMECMVLDLVAPMATIDFKRAYVTGTGEVVGVFELVTYDADLALPIFQQGRIPFVSARLDSIQFKDPADQWRDLDEFPVIGDVFPGPEIKTVKAGQRFQFRHRLFRRDVLKYGGMEFRLKLFNNAKEGRPRCVLSFPFSAAPVMRRPTQLRPVPHKLPVLLDARRTYLCAPPAKAGCRRAIRAMNQPYTCPKPKGRNVRPKLTAE